MKPLIALTATTAQQSSVNRILVSEAYVRALEKAGATVIVLPYQTLSIDEAHRLAQQFDGFVFSGGEDLEPKRYGENPHEKLGAVNPTRDEFEFILFSAVRQAHKPILAICRGCQLAVAATGGKLIQHLPDETTVRHDINEETEETRSLRVQNVSVMPKSTLARVLGVTMHRVNTLHHQAAAGGTPELNPVAWCTEDNTIEALEGENILAVQWHPEFFWREEGLDNGLFTWLVQQVRKR